MMKHKRWIRGIVTLLALTLLTALLPGLPVYGLQSSEGSPVKGGTPQAFYNGIVTAASISVPAYSGGKSSDWMTYDCGAGVTYGNTGSESKMQIVTGTTEAQYKTYCTKLESNSYSKIYSKTLAAQSGNNLYAKYLANDGTHALYTYFTAAYKQTRIIVDTQCESFRSFSYAGSGSYRTEFYMYGLSAADDGFTTSEALSTRTRSNGGTMLFMRMADNSLFLIDGGGNDQMCDRSCEELYSFLRRVTGTSHGEKIVINTWFITHPHVDHCAGIARFLHKYSEHFDLRNIMYNFDVVSGSPEYVQRVARLFPDARFYKQHTGESFKVCDVQFDVLYTVEDRYFPNSSNQLIKGDKTCMDNTNENNISTVLRVSFGGKKMILTGDIGNADTILMKMYPASALKADLLQLPHHGFDDHTTLAKTVSPSVSFLNQSGSTAENRKDIYNFAAAWSPYAGTIYYGGSHTVGYAADTGVFLKEPFQALDFLNWNGRTYELQEATPYSGSKVYAPEQYHRYTKVNRLTTADNAYLIVDKKLNRVLSYDVTTGTAKTANTGLFDGTNWYFADQDRHAVNWLIHCTRSAQPHDRSPMQNNQVITYYSGTPVWKGTGGYWATGTYPGGLTLGYENTYASSGLLGCWSPITEELEAASNWTWIDALEDDSFLIYRHDNGTYYPLYRDGNIAQDDGWGGSKRTGEQIRKDVNYLKTNLYLYEEASSKLYVTWTGHKDYTCYTGIPSNNLLSLLSADLRVKWAFDSFSGSGEAFHTSSGRKNPGEYWLEFSPAYNPSTARDYKTTIKYKTANNTILEVGSFTVHVKNRDSKDPEPKQLFFDFGNTAADQSKYKNESQYKEINFDGTSRWTYCSYLSSTNKTSNIPGGVNTAEGTLTIRKTKATDEANSMYIQAFGKSSTPLSFDPKYAEVLQIRFKMDNLKAVANKNPFFRLWYFKENGEQTYDRHHSFGTSFTSDGKYGIITMNLYTPEDISANSAVSGFPTQTMNSLSKVTGIRLSFHEFTLTDPTQDGSVTIDYIYMGPEKDLPIPRYTVTFQNEDGTLLQTTQVYKGETAVYVGAVPTKAHDCSYHYAFKGWDKALTNITADTTITATYTAAAHSFSYAKVDTSNHKASCSCGYSRNEGHSYTTKVTVPTCTAQGYTTYTCSRCSHSYKDNYVAAKGHTEIIDKAVPATCTASGKTEGKHCSVCNVVLVAQQTIPATGHTEVIDKAIPATCTADGLTEGRHCETCGEVLLAPQAVPATGHSDTTPADNRCDICGDRIKEAVLRFRTISLKGNIAINYYMDLSDEVAADENAYMLFTMEDGEQIKVPASEGEYSLYQKAYYYSFTCAVSAMEMTDTVLCQFFWSGGQTEAYTYSVKTYADRILASSTSAKLHNLIYAMLNYGAASQIYFDYHTERLANAGQEVPDYTQITVDGYPVNTKQGTTLATYAGASLLLTSETTLRIFFTVDSSIAEQFTVTYKGEILPLGIRSGKYYADIHDIGAKDLDEYFTLTIFDGTETAEVSYSPLSYCASIIENAKGIHDRELQDVAAAMYLYSQAANTYFAK